MRVRVLVFVLAVLLAAVAYAVISRTDRKEPTGATVSPAVTGTPRPRPPEVAGDAPEEDRPLQKAPSRVFRGTVVEAKTLRPLDGASVCLLGRDQRGPALAEGTTGADGSYALGAGGAVEVDAIEVRRMGFLPRRDDVYGEPGEAQDFELERARMVKGKVHLRGGTPVASGRVFVLEKDEIRSSGVHSPIALDGTFVAAAEGDEVAILAVGDAFQPGVSGLIDLRSGDAPEVRIEVETGRSVTGIVQDGSGRPIPGAFVEASTSSPELDSLRIDAELDLPDGIDPAAMTDAEGRFTLGGCGLDPMEIRVRAEGFQPQDAEEEDGAFRITLETKLVKPTRKLTVSVSGLPPDVPLPGRAYLVTTGYDEMMELEGAGYALEGFSTDAGKGWIQVMGFERVPVRWPEGKEDHHFGEIGLERGRTLEISVVDGRGRGIEEAAVILEPSTGSCGNYDGLGDVPFETDGEGLLFLGGLWKQAHGFWVSKPGFITKETWVPTEDLSQKASILLEEEAVVRGRALGAAGEPLARTGVRFRLDEYNRCGDATDWTGSFLVRLPAGRELEGILLAPHAAPTPFRVAALAPGERRDLGDVRVHPGETLRGQAIGEDGTPLAMHAIFIDRVHESDDADELGRSMNVPDTKTDRDGRFEFRGLLPGRYTVRVFLEESSHQERAANVPFPGTFLFAVDDPELQMYAGVVRQADGSPAHGASVTLASRESREENFYEHVETNEEGKFKFRGVPQDLFLPVARVSYGLLSASFHADSVPGLPADLVLEQGSTLAIRVELEEKPAVPVPCTLGFVNREGGVWGELGAGPDAVIRSERVPPGSLRGVVNAPGYLPEKIEIEARKDQVFAATVALKKLPPTRTCSFLVKDPEGNPLRDAWIRASLEVRHLQDRCATEKDGTGELALVTHVDNGVTVRKDGYYPVRLHAADIGEREQVEVVLHPNGEILAHVSIPGDPTDLDYSLWAEPLEVPRWEGSQSKGGYTVAKPGDHEIVHLPAGRYALLVLCHGGSKPWVLARHEATVIDGQQTEVHIELPAHFQIRGAVTSAGKPLAGKPVVLSTSKDGREYRLRGKLDEGGRFSRSACVAGSYTVSVGDGGALRRIGAFEITGDAELELELER